ncbi:MAG: hypothetical protein IBJ09_15435 [Bacteroidia bacterium]|nr:hypothetical protein [Bacteroidia bacterium]
MKYNRIIAMLGIMALSFSASVTTVSAAGPFSVNVPAGTVIDQFLAMLDGTEEAAGAAIKKYGSADVIANGMIPFGKNPKKVLTEDNCVRFSLEWDDQVNVYEVCEKDGKISYFDWYFDESEEQGE